MLAYLFLALAYALGEANGQQALIAEYVYKTVNSTDVSSTVAAISSIIAFNSWACMAMCAKNSSCVLAVLKTANNNCSFYNSSAYTKTVSSLGSGLYQKRINGYEEISFSWKFNLKIKLIYIFLKHVCRTFANLSAVLTATSGLINYWPVKAGVMTDLAGNVSTTSSSPQFTTNRFGNPNDAILVNSASSAWDIPNGVYFYGDFSVTAWVNNIQCGANNILCELFICIYMYEFYHNLYYKLR
jgi:hypothetical protein